MKSLNALAVLLVISLFVCFSYAATADADRHLRKGYISNHSGKKCWYKQSTDSDSTYFYGIKHTVGVIVFDDSKCMSGGELGKVSINTNIMMINNVISMWYSHKDAGFLTNASDLYDGSAMQKNGKCIYSRTYPEVVGIAVEYLIRDGSIYSVMHGQSLMGCKNR